MSGCEAAYSGLGQEALPCSRRRHWWRGLHVHTGPGRRVEWYADRAGSAWGVQVQLDEPGAAALSGPAVAGDTLEIPVTPRTTA